VRLAAGVLFAACALQFGCANKPEKPAPQSAAPAAEPVKITQFYATAPKLAAGEQELLCYGVSGAKKVWLSPPRQELSAALSRCVEVKPKETTVYTLTAEGDHGAPATSELTVTLGLPHAKIVEVTVSSLTAKPGQDVSLCYHVQFASTVTIAPIGFHAGPGNHGCAMVQPQKTTTYVVSATGPGGDRDEQPVTVKVR
jgi:hypothetical protein